MQLRARLRIATIALGLIGGLLAPQAVQAHTTTYDSDITLRYDRPYFKGRVDGPRPRCRRNRHVYLHRRHNGDHKVVGHTVTNDNGRYRFRRPNPNGTYWTTTPRKGPFGGPYHAHFCSRAKSREIRKR